MGKFSAAQVLWLYLSLCYHCTKKELQALTELVSRGRERETELKFKKAFPKSQTQNVVFLLRHPNVREKVLLSVWQTASVSWRASAVKASDRRSCIQSS